jgi:hypothetical protein
MLLLIEYVGGVSLIQYLQSSRCYSYRDLGSICVVLSLLHGGGHLVHGCYDDAAGLAQAPIGVRTLSSIDLETEQTG